MQSMRRFIFVWGFACASTLLGMARNIPEPLFSEAEIEQEMAVELVRDGDIQKEMLKKCSYEHDWAPVCYMAPGELMGRLKKLRKCFHLESTKIGEYEVPLSYAMCPEIIAQCPHVRVIQLVANEQHGDSCTFHAFFNALSLEMFIQKLIRDGRAITPEAIEHGAPWVRAVARLLSQRSYKPLFLGSLAFSEHVHLAARGQTYEKWGLNWKVAFRFLDHNPVDMGTFAHAITKVPESALYLSPLMMLCTPDGYGVAIKSYPQELPVYNAVGIKQELGCAFKSEIKSDDFGPTYLSVNAMIEEYLRSTQGCIYHFICRTDNCVLGHYVSISLIYAGDCWIVVHQDSMNTSMSRYYDWKKEGNYGFFGCDCPGLPFIQVLDEIIGHGISGDRRSDSPVPMKG